MGWEERVVSWYHVGVPEWRWERRGSHWVIEIRVSERGAHPTHAVHVSQSGAVFHLGLGISAGAV